MTESHTEQVRVTVMIMTFNEAGNLAAAVESFPKGTNVIVFDSFSADGTAELARNLGARIVSRAFDDWSSHQNWAVTNIDFDSPWVYYADADERMTPKLWDEIQLAALKPNGFVAYEMRRKDMFLGRWLRHSSFYPTWFVRLFRPSAIRWERLVNPVPIVDGQVGRLQEHFLHYPFSKGTMQWFDRHIKYADLEAQEFMRETAVPMPWSQLASTDARTRRRALKAFYYRMPLRPFLRFVTLYLIKGGFIDGRAGFYYAAMQSAYELMLQMRITELKRLMANRLV
jgi:glycosyltransferase involved in cell wall biosynthesis